MTRSPLRRLAVAGATTAALLTVTVGIVPQTAGAAPARPEAAGPRTQGPKPVDVQLLAINDFHGNLEAPSGSGGRIQTGVSTTGSAVTVDAGGVEYLATQLRQLSAPARSRTRSPSPPAT